MIVPPAYSYLTGLKSPPKPWGSYEGAKYDEEAGRRIEAWQPGKQGSNLGEINMKHFLPLLVVVMMAIPSLAFAIDQHDCVNRYDINPVNLKFGPILIGNSTKNDVLMHFGDASMYTFHNSTKEHACFREEQTALCYEQYYAGQNYSVVFIFGSKRVKTVDLYPNGTIIPGYIKCTSERKAKTHALLSYLSFGNTIDEAAQLIGPPTYLDDRIYIALFENEFNDGTSVEGTSYTAYIIEHIYGKIQKIRISRHYTF